MKKKIKVLISGLLLLSMLSAEISYSIDLVSRYIFRGIDFGDVVDYDGVGLKNNSPAYQPGIEYALGESGLAIGAWASFGLGTNSSQEVDELDYYLSYSFSKRDIDYTIGYTHYTFPSLISFTQRVGGFSEYDAIEAWTSDEINLGLTFNKFNFTPSIKIYYDYDGNATDESKYAYTEIGFSLPKIKDLNQSLTLAIDGTKYSVGCTNVNYQLSKDYGNNIVGYLNLIAITGSVSGVGTLSGETVNDNGVVRDRINKDSYEIVVGINYQGGF